MNKIYTIYLLNKKLFFKLFVAFVVFVIISIFLYSYFSKFIKISKSGTLISNQLEQDPRERYKNLYTIGTTEFERLYKSMNSGFISVGTNFSVKGTEINFEDAFNHNAMSTKISDDTVLACFKEDPIVIEGISINPWEIMYSFKSEDKVKNIAYSSSAYNYNQKINYIKETNKNSKIILGYENEKREKLVWINIFNQGCGNVY